jgi:energy-coupling factor transport system substrate-specific component
VRNTNTQKSTAQTSPRITPQRNSVRSLFRWRVVDIVVAAVLGVAAGLVFWLWSLAYQPLSVVLGFTPGLEGLTAGGWLFAGILGGLIIRRPGAAIFTSVVAGVVEALLGNAWGTGNIIFALVQGVGAEIGIALFAYASSRIYVAMIAGALSGVANVLITIPLYYSGVVPMVVTVYAISAIVSGIVLGGVVAWALARGLARAGALARFPIAHKG